MLFNYMRDYNDRYTGTIIGKRTEHGIIPIKVGGVTGNVRSPMAVGHSILPSGNLEVDSKLWSFKDPDMMLHAPKLGMCGSEGRLAFVKRIPVKRWKQGLALDSCNISHLVRAGREQLNLYDIFNPQGNAFEEAFAKTLKSATGHRINQSLGLVGTNSDKECSLVYRDAVIGTVTNNGRKIIVPENYQPMLDTFKRAGAVFIEFTENINPPLVGSWHGLEDKNNSVIVSNALRSLMQYTGDVDRHAREVLCRLYSEPATIKYEKLARLDYGVKTMLAMKGTPEFNRLIDTIRGFCSVLKRSANNTSIWRITDAYSFTRERDCLRLRRNDDGVTNLYLNTIVKQLVLLATGGKRDVEFVKEAALVLYKAYGGGVNDDYRNAFAELYRMMVDKLDKLRRQDAGMINPEQGFINLNMPDGIHRFNIPRPVVDEFEDDDDD